MSKDLQNIDSAIDGKTGTSRRRPRPADVTASTRTPRRADPDTTRAAAATPSGVASGA